MKLYTKTGDDGTTSLFGGVRVSKADPRVEAYGTVDEANAAIGWARAAHLDALSDAVLARVQEDLFSLGAELACAPGRVASIGMARLGTEDIERLESAIDEATERCPPLRQFILPGGSRQAAALHVARTVCRRAERWIVALSEDPPRREIVVYLNRLSDLLFALARVANVVARVSDVPWQGASPTDT
ncbi:MAG: cob(I)yrinic acid a,c-diamide adenosyltransferase [Polyangiaceae bacterium]|jgi:cob(I)alamin adenosyltransferase